MISFFPDDYESMVSVKRFQEYLWVEKGYDVLPEYDISQIPNSQDINKAWVETHGFYMVQRTAFERHKTRVCGDTYLYIVSDIESFDINTEQDIRIAEALSQTICRNYI
jgi:CMP-N-acetylneuraminic acid synthetase